MPVLPETLAFRAAGQTARRRQSPGESAASRRTAFSHWSNLSRVGMLGMYVRWRVMRLPYERFVSHTCFHTSACSASGYDASWSTWSSRVGVRQRPSSWRSRSCGRRRRPRPPWEAPRGAHHRRGREQGVLSMPSRSPDRATFRRQVAERLATCQDPGLVVVSEPLRDALLSLGFGSGGCGAGSLR